MGIMFSSANFMGMTNLMSVMPVVGYERVVFYRERAASMYDAFAYGIAIALVEMPYLLVQVRVRVRDTRAEQGPYLCRGNGGTCVSALSCSVIMCPRTRALQDASHDSCWALGHTHTHTLLSTCARTSGPAPI